MSFISVDIGAFLLKGLLYSALPDICKHSREAIFMVDHIHLKLIAIVLKLLKTKWLIPASMTHCINAETI